MTRLLFAALALALIGLILAGAVPPVAGLLALAILLGVVYWGVRDRIHNILLMFFGVFLALVVAQSPVPRLSDPEGVQRLQQLWGRGTFDSRLPAVLHLVFDEMISPGGIDGELPGGGPAREALYTIGERYSLRTYDSVYSRAFFSGESLPNLFDTEYRGITGREGRFPLVMVAPQNAYFDAMAAQGYRTAVFQTSHLNFCANGSVDMCETFPSFDPSVVRSEAALTPRARVVHVLSVLLRSYEPSYLSRYGQRALTGKEREDFDILKMGTAERFDVQGFTTWFDRFLGFVERVPRGTHLFAHFMVPHGPYLLTADCAPGGKGGAGYYLADRFRDPVERAEARRQHYAAYLAQLRCVGDRISAFLDVVARNPALADARILIHGDHGSRISGGNMVEDHGRDDFVANYATYFAVRAPGVAPGLDCTLMSLPEAFRRHVAAPPATPLDRPHPPVFVSSRAGAGAVVEAPMPAFGCAAGSQGR